jgi:hypothetical protein
MRYSRAHRSRSVAYIILQIDLWEEGKLECLAKLGRWEDLNKSTLVEFHNLDDLFEEKNMVQKEDVLLLKKAI